MCDELERTEFPSELARLRYTFRRVVRMVYRERTGNPKATVRWTAVGYAHGVVGRGHLMFVGWPTWADIPFGDPSSIPGGVPILQYLLDLWESGVLRFEEADADFIDLAKRNPKAVLPGRPIDLPAPRCWGPYPRDDLGLARARPVTNPEGRPLRKNWLVGALTPKVIDDEFEYGIVGEA
ncbi:hypothetical protein C8Q76DRAFT_688707 [Earliella scabrosa]|nr:hypothetical protein C8Q76DRAFT_688707 [Earliella scabrosa]